MSQKPVLTISPIVIFPELKTMALGGVATGSIKAQDAATAAPINRGSGGIFREAANVINKGKTILADAVFEVTSVKKFILAMTISEIHIACKKSIAIN